LTPPFGCTHEVWTVNLGLRNTEISLCRVEHNIFWYVEPFRCGSLVWQMDRIMIAIASI